MERSCARASIDRGRHLRAVACAIASFAAASAAYYWFGFDRVHAIGYCATAFVALLLMNRRAMFEAPDVQSGQGKR